jgi:hypothetical protein
MMQAKGRISGREIRYIPEAFGNREAQDPVAITYRVPTERERRELLVFGGGKDQEDVILEKQHRAIRRCVVKVENYTDQAGKPIVDGAALAEHGDSLIVFEMVNQIMSTVEPGEAEEKKSEGSPG